MAGNGKRRPEAPGDTPQRHGSRRGSKDALFEGFAAVGRALASGRRLEILDLLAQSARSVDEVAAELDQPIANASHHLRALAQAGLLRSRKDGTRVYYSLASDAVGRLWVSLQEVASTHLAQIGRLAEEYLGERAGIETVSRARLADEMRRRPLTLLDVRPAAEYRAGHIPGAVSVPPVDADRVLRRIPRDADVVAYCRGEYCVFADDVVRALTRRKIRARRLEDGFPQWRTSGLPVAVGDQD